MNGQDWITVAALVVAVASIAYALGTRRRDAATPPAKKAGAGAAAEKEAPAREEGAAKPKAAKADAGNAAVKDSGGGATVAKKTDEEPALAKLEYEEDEEIDPTKVGAAPASVQERIVYQPPVTKIVYDEDAAEDEPTRRQSLFLVSATAQTDTGLRRKRNEDSLLVMEKEGVFVVADGMGGYRGGELASQLAVKVIADAFKSGAFESDAHEGVPLQASELARAMQMANAAIQEAARKKRELEGMGTTLCAARFSPNKKRVYIGHVGDSRCYRLRDGVFSQMTADHTMADHGVKGPEAAHLSRAVGIWPTVPIDIVLGVPLPNDVYLLCSDGLTKMLNDDIIANVLRSEEDPKQAVDRLILFANARGGKDNITVVLVRVVPPDWKPKTAEPFADVKSGGSRPPPSA